MKKLLLSSYIFLCLTNWAGASNEALFQGHISIDINTNIPGFNFKGKTKQKVSVKTKENGEKISSVQLEIDPSLLDTGISLRNKHMKEKVFKNKKIIFNSSQIVCASKKKCTITGSLKIGENTKKLDLTVDKISKDKFSLKQDLSLKAMKVQKLEFMKLKVLDNVTINGTFERKK